MLAETNSRPVGGSWRIDPQAVRPGPAFEPVSAT